MARLLNEPVMLAHNRSLGATMAWKINLHEVALLPSPPSGSKYTDGAGAVPVSLGVHEHWE